MTMTLQQSGDGLRHCERLEIDWQDSTSPSQTALVEGEHLAIAISVLHRGERSEDAPQPQGEEVATVLEGEFLVEAAGERYELSPGEGIIIPPREPRVWTCLSERGALYRVITHLDRLPPPEGA
ncbi:cupin domain-containing protein [Herbaspirillum sp. alder98]|uniref:cupin domain-containing protein n=1 Tax=Herbaspirillum sp. alder98 TaxID=2913096 RepID=UPI001CD8A7F3|nr:cupin domain-containing protein [Herbaspirillum sp. alder98]MCA1326866.1 cupin domain-containing protein [Herbaspirillum sp. alder98]